MKGSLTYLIEKLTEINYKMSIHEGTANQRLASKSVEILFLEGKIPEEYRKQFNKLIIIIKKTLKNIDYPRVPCRLKGIYNKTAVKYIKLLIDIEEDCKARRDDLRRR